MKKIFVILLTLLFVPSLSYSEQKPYKFFKNEILFGLAKKQLKNDTRSISSKKALSIYEGDDGKAIKITLDPEFKGHKDDWDRTGERNQRWEVANKGKQMNLKNSVFIKYVFKLSKFDPGRTGGSFFQVIGNKNKSRLLPWMKIQYDGFEVFLTLALTKEVFYLSGDLDNTNFDKMSYKFYLGTLHDFRDFRTIDIKIIPSKSDNGEVILWLDGEKKVELYGTNFTIGNAFSFKLGKYKFFNGTPASSVQTSSLFIKKFGYDKNCEVILSPDQCNYSSSSRQSYSKLFGSNNSRRDSDHGKKIAKSVKFKKELPGFNIKFDEKLENTKKDMALKIQKKNPKKVKKYDPSCFKTSKFGMIVNTCLNQ